MLAIKGSHLEDTWLLQILAIVGSLLSIAAIAILLAKSENKPIFHWNGLSINVLVAIFAALAKALLAFTLSECLGQVKWIWLSWHQRPLRDLDIIDNSSRGPLGSIKLLGQPMARSFISFGAIAVILSVAIDPFAQLTIGKRDEVKFEDDPSARLALAGRYSKGAYTTYSAARLMGPDGNNYSSTTTDADFSMKSAILYGISQSDELVTQQTKRYCSSGNCTWDTFESLAVCSACNDITSSLKRVNLGADSPLDVKLGTLSNGASRRARVTEYQLPNGLRLNNGNEGPSTTYMTTYGSGDESKSMSFSDKDTLIWSQSMIRVIDIDAQWPDVPLMATECALWYCVNRYTSTVKNGNLSETIHPTRFEKDPNSWQASTQQPAGNELAHTPPDTLDYNISSASVSRTDLQIGRFNVSQAAIYGISDFLNSTFGKDSGVSGITGYVVNMDEVHYVPTVMQTLYDSPDWTVSFATLAKSMTNSMRQYGDDGAVAVGKTGTNQTLVQVYWYYLILPIVLILAGAIFLAIVIYYTHATGTAVWGTNILPAVALGKRVGDLLEDSVLLSQMEAKAKSQRIDFAKPGQDINPKAMTTSYATIANHDVGNYAIAPQRKVSVTQTHVDDAVSEMSYDGRVSQDGAPSSANTF